MRRAEEERVLPREVAVPAGVLRFVESLEEGAKREVKEETGFDIRITGQAMTY